jgi:hypothetical protein
MRWSPGIQLDFGRADDKNTLRLGLARSRTLTQSWSRLLFAIGRQADELAASWTHAGERGRLRRGHEMQWRHALSSPGYLVTASVLKLMLTLTR